MIRAQDSCPKAIEGSDPSAAEPARTVDDPRVVEVVEQYRATLEAGDEPDRQRLLDRFPQLAEELSACLDGLEFVTRVAPQLQDGDDGGPKPHAIIRRHATLGDFRILREIGRGGMGVVYEAEQLSLHRRVALKVLPFAAILDGTNLKRFKNEALAAATLDHPHIVSIYCVGSERGVHYYAMQLIDGQTLAATIHELRQLTKQSFADGAPATVDYSSLTADFVSGRLPLADSSKLPTDEREEGQPPSKSVAASPLADTRRELQAGFSTDGSIQTRAYFQNVARLGIQAAQALDDAHAHGILHRDIKPSNLLIDGEGKLWVTDFGLARIESEVGVTMTGDVLGTLRYMCPETAAGGSKRLVVDQRADIYSLGVTLYELLTLEPAFGGQDCKELFQKIVFTEPRPPRRLSKAIPTDLETIVLKAMRKDPADRYTAAGDLADDLQRFLNHEPIRAKPPTLFERAVMWSRRNRGLVTASVIFLMLLASAIGWMLRDRQAREQAIAGERAARQTRVTEQVEYFVDVARGFQSEQKWSEALSAAKRAQAALAGGGAPEEMEAKVRQMVADLELVKRLDEIRVLGDFDLAGASRQAAATFREHGIDLESLTTDEAATRLRSRAGVLPGLIAALDDWADTRRRFDEAGAKSIWDLAQAVDTDPWRCRVREALAAGDERALVELADSLESAQYGSITISLLAFGLYENGRPEQALHVCRVALREHPDDFWIHWVAAGAYGRTRPPRYEEVVCHYTAALALNPQCPPVLINLGNALAQQEKLEDAIACYRKAIELEPTRYANAHNNLGIALASQGQWEEAMACYLKALEIDPNFVSAQNNLGAALASQGQWEKAIACFLKALEIDPNFVIAQNNLGGALANDGRLDEAQEHLEQTLEIRRRDLGLSMNNLAWHLVIDPDQPLADAKRAVQLATKAVEFAPENGASQNTLGVAHYRVGDFRAAIDALAESLHLQGDNGHDYCFLAMAHWQLGHEDEARRYYDQAVQWTKDNDPTNKELHRFIAEAAQLLGMPSPFPSMNDKPPQSIAPSVVPSEESE